VRMVRWQRAFFRYASAISIGALAALLSLGTFRALPAEVAWLKAENVFFEGDWESAVDYSRDGINSNPSHPKLYKTIGESYISMVINGRDRVNRWSQLEGAVKALDTAVKLSPMEYENRLLLADALTKTGLYLQGGLEAQEAIRLNPIQGYGYSVYAAALAASGRLEELEESLRLYACFNSLPRVGSKEKEIDEVRQRIRDKRGE
jgi:tetratricopeptide (TPR) repeat protein